MKLPSFIPVFCLLVLFFLMGSFFHPRKTKKVKYPFGTWMRSQEEDKDPNSTWQLYRPSGYPFPAARGRSGFVLKKNGEFSIIRPSSLDGSEIFPGSWSATENGYLKITVPNSSLSEFRWKQIKKDLIEVEIK